jgi:hypothetical protein
MAASLFQNESAFNIFVNDNCDPLIVGINEILYVIMTTMER